MKNLVHLPLEKLEQAPSRLSMPWFPTRGSSHLNNYDREWPDRHHDAWRELHKTMRRIIYTSIGKNWDEIYSRLKEMMVGVSFRFDIDKLVEGIVSTPTWSYRNQRWEVLPGGYRGRHLVDLSGHIQSIKVKSYLFYPDEFYYICPKSNILRLVRSKELRREKNSEFWRRHYKFITDRKRKDKACRRERNNDTILKMINDPDLLKFYSEAVKDYRALIKATEKHETEEKPKDYFAQAVWRMHNRQQQEYFIHIESLKNQIEELEAGNFNTFFESAVYLYGRQKECHHVATP